MDIACTFELKTCRANAIFIYSSTMNLQGKIEKFNVPDIFETIAENQMAGTLGINRDNESAILYFDNGRLTYAYSPDNNNRLGKIFIAKNIIDITTLEESIAIQQNQENGNRLGEILLENEHINQEQLKDSLTEQITDIAFRVMVWDSGVYKFYDGKFPTREDMVLSLPIESLISDGKKRVDELKQLKEKLPDFSQFLKLKTISRENEIELKLSAEQWNILVFCNGRNNIHKILNESDIDPNTILTALIKFIDDGLIEISSEPESETSKDNDNGLERQIDILSDLLGKFLAES